MTRIAIAATFLFLMVACKQKEASKQETSTSTTTQAAKESNNDIQKDNQTVKLEEKDVKKQIPLMPEFVPASGKSNWHAEYNETNEHLVGIFRFSKDIDWREFMATMHYAEPNEVIKSMVWQAKTEWWTKRDVLANIETRNLMAYKREDKTGNWYFAFNPRNFEVYFWR